MLTNNEDNTSHCSHSTTGTPPESDPTMLGLEDEEDYGVPLNGKNEFLTKTIDKSSDSNSKRHKTRKAPMADIPRKNSKNHLHMDNMNNVPPAAVDRIMARRPSADHLADLLHLPPPPHSVVAPCRVGILLHSTVIMDRASRVMDHSISFCKLTALCLLQGQHQQQPDTPIHNTARVSTSNHNNHTDNNDSDDDNAQDNDAEAREWLRTVKADPNLVSTTNLASLLLEVQAEHQHVRFHSGIAGLQAMLDAKDIDAIYVVVPMESRRQYVLQCLRANKHVLIRDLRSTSLTEFQEQLTVAREQRRFVQFSTMFDIQYNVQAFLDTVSTNEQFGRIDVISAELDVCDADLDKVGASYPLQAADSCIHRLARYCILMALLMTPAEPTQPVQAQITHCVWDGDVLTSARGHVLFDNGRELKLAVSYSAVRTRQLLEVRAATKYAVVTEFAIGTHGLHSFRVYDKELDPVTGKSDITSGEALDVPSGLPQHVMMWRGFAELCQSVTQLGWEDAAEATFLTQTAISLKATIAALEESARRDNALVPIVLDYAV